MTDKEKIRNRFNRYLKRTDRKYGKFFDYSNSIYVDLNTEILIKCPIHGEFYQTPLKHVLLKDGGCAGCSKNNKKKIVRGQVSGHSKEDFLLQAKAKFGDRFVYDLSVFKYFGYPNIKIICPIHGEFEIAPYRHISSKFGCNKCSVESTTKLKRFSYNDIINKVTEVHGNKYSLPDYNEKKYQNTQHKIDVICKIHGLFRITTTRLLQGKGCQICSSKINNNPGVYSFKLFESIPELIDKPAYIYYLKINDGEYYKIGITTNSIAKRISYFKSGVGVFNVILVKSKKTTLFEAFKAEQLILDEMKNDRVLSPFSTEVFNRDIYEQISFFFEDEKV